MKSSNTVILGRGYSKTPALDLDENLDLRWMNGLRQYAAGFDVGLLYQQTTGLSVFAAYINILEHLGR